jgi:hypothetical protein
MDENAQWVAGVQAIVAFGIVALALVIIDHFWNKPRSSSKRGKSGWHLDNPLLVFGKDKLTIRDSFEGTLILGGSGSGKTSGSCQAITESCLAKGFGAVFLTTKPGEKEMLLSYCQRTGRLGDVIVVDRSERWRCNFMDHEMTRAGLGGGLTHNVVELMTVCLDIGNRGGGKGDGREDAKFWQDTFKQLCRNAVDVLSGASQPISIGNLHRVVTSAARSLKETDSTAWRENSECYQWLFEAYRRGIPADKQTEFENLSTYFMRELPALSDKTRSTIETTFTSMVDVLNRGIGRRILCTDSTFTPEMVEDGKIFILDFPILEYGFVGQLIQGILKYQFQRALERRNFTSGSRPVLILADEFQHFVNLHDFLFQSTARQFGVATVYATQNIESVVSMLGGGPAAESIADAIFGNLATKIFHANASVKTNQWAAEIIGRSRQWLVNSSTSQQSNGFYSDLMGFGSPVQTSAGVSEHIDYEIQPGHFPTLRKGGPGNNCEVDAVMFGRRWRQTGKTWRRVTFKQR